MNAFIEPFFFCLIASMIWAPIVFLIASRFHYDEGSAVFDKLWPAALFLAAMPALIAPVTAALGLSLRAPEPLPPMSAPVAVQEYTTAAPVVSSTPLTTSIGISDVLTAAAGLYFYGFLLFFCLGAVRMIWFSYRVNYAYEVDEPQLEKGFDQWRRRMKLKRMPRYAFTDAVSSVCVHGFFRPTILMPMNLLDRVSVDDAILMGAHEMAHIRRGDTWLFAFATITKAVFWFNPFIHRIAARANLTAEQAADALVISCGANRKDYAKCFVEGLRFAANAPRNDYALVPSFTPFDKRSRRERLDAILSKTGVAPLMTLASKMSLVISILMAFALAFAQAAFAVSPKPVEEALSQIPVEGEVTFGFGDKSKKLGDKRPSHEGIDIRAALGTVVRAAGDGKVVDATSRYKGKKSWGNVVVIDHGHGLVTRYAHMDSFSVKKGDRVKAGDKIGAVGSTGKSTGPHLHFEVIQDGQHVDPSHVISVGPVKLPAFRTAKRSFQPVRVAKAPEAVSRVQTVVKPPALPTPPSVEVTVIAPSPAELELDEQLAGKLARMDTKVRDELKNFKGFADFDIEFEGFEELVEDMGDIDFNSDFIEDFQIELPKIANLSSHFELTEEDKRELKRARKEAKREAERTLKQARQEIARANKERELAVREITRDFERSLRDREHEVENRIREQEHALEESRRHDKEEVLTMREQALLEAQEQIEEEREEIIRRLEEIKDQKRNYSRD